MVFSDTTNKTGLVEDTDFICGTDATSYPLVDKARHATRHTYKAVIDILKTEGRVQFDDSNHTTLPESTFTLVNAQSDYSLPTNLLKLWAIEIQDNGGNWIRLKEMDIQDPAMRRTVTDFAKTNGTPSHYELRGDSIRLLPAPATGSVTMTNGGKMFFAREIDAFTAADTTQEPGIPEPFHKIVSLGMSMDWLLVNDTSSKVDRVVQQYEQLRAELREFCAKKNKDVKVGIRPFHRTEHYL